MRITPTGIIFKKGISFQGVSGLQISDINQLQTALNGKANTTDVYTIAAADLQLATQTLYDALVTAVGLKAVATNVYTIAAADLQFATKASYTTLATAVGLKALATDVYTKLEITDALALKANTTNVNTKTEITDALTVKANKLTTYSKTETLYLLKTNVDINLSNVSNYISARRIYF